MVQARNRLDNTNEERRKRNFPYVLMMRFLIKICEVSRKTFLTLLLGMLKGY